MLGQRGKWWGKERPTRRRSLPAKTAEVSGRNARGPSAARPLPPRGPTDVGRVSPESLRLVPVSDPWTINPVH